MIDPVRWKLNGQTAKDGLPENVFWNATEWGNYVSLPQLWRTDEYKPLVKSFFRPRMVVAVHPGHYGMNDVYVPTNPAHETYDPYLDSLRRFLKQEENVIAYVSVLSLKGALKSINMKKPILVPTYTASPSVRKDTLGVDDDKFYGFLREVGLKEVRICGEFVNGCIDVVADKFQSVGISVKILYECAIGDDFHKERSLLWTPKTRAFWGTY